MSRRGLQTKFNHIFLKCAVIYFWIGARLLCIFLKKGNFVYFSVESLQSYFILTMSHWSSGLPVCFPSQGTRVQLPRGVLMWNRDSPISLSPYIGDPGVIDHCGLVWDRPRPELSLGPSADKSHLISHSFPVPVSRSRQVSLRLHNQQSWLLFPVTRDLGLNPLGGTYVKTGFSC
jgi:hypothetical protein